MIKEKIKDLGADICGFAPVDRFNDAPDGFHPLNIYKDCKTVIVFALKVPQSLLSATNIIPYSHFSTILINEVDALTIKMVKMFEELDIGCVPIPTDDPYEHWEPERSYGRAILSLRHAGYLAGLGILGKNTLLMNKEYGNMIQLGAVLVNIELDEDPLASYEGCLTDCQICLDSCPQGALDGITVNQKLCRQQSIYKTEKGYTLKRCNLCRKKCPNALRIK
ncbi:MAG: epoxyqueuosine reductase [Candidatus Lokiarchaeia archaeon]|nr:epoxyqueuosine reductase [Candidatus Lokiarchaeia archaeon]